MLKVILILLLATPAFALDVVKVETYEDLVCEQITEDTFRCKVETIYQSIPPAEKSGAEKPSALFPVPKAIAPAIVLPIVRFIVVEVGKSMAVDLIKQAILKQYKESFPTKPLPKTVLLQKAH